METPKPTVIIGGPSYGASAREKAWAIRLKRILAIPPDEEAVIRKVLANIRRRQTLKLGHKDEDPSPYDPDYIFYCLEGKRET